MVATAADDTKKGSRERPKNIKGERGVLLKHFEVVVGTILPTIQPEYTTLPSVPAHSSSSAQWPYDALPSNVRVLNSIKPERALRKEQQVSSMLRCIVRVLPPKQNRTKNFTIVDFGGGSGHLAIPLALLLPDCSVVCVDLGERSLRLLHEKAASCVDCPSFAKQKDAADSSTVVWPKKCKTRTAIPNLSTYYGDADSYPEPFDMALALHLCGEATDVVLRLAGQQKAASIVVAPCCVGKLSGASKNPYVFQATGQNAPTVHYPQSAAFCQLVREQSDWNALAKAADYSDMGECRTSRNAARRTAKALLETDRRLFLETTFGYQTSMTRMEPWECTPKNDILIAWQPARFSESPINTTQTDVDCQTDIALTINHLLPRLDNGNFSGLDDRDKVDWTMEEEEDIKEQLVEFLESTKVVLVFPTRMGGRKRKIIHYVAAQMNLAHWCEGNRSSERTVAVARKNRKRPLPLHDWRVEKDMVKTFQRDGVVVLRSVLSKEELQMLEAGVEFNQANPGHLAAIASSTEDTGEFFEDFCNWNRIPQFECVMKESHLPRIAAQLTVSQRVRLYHDHVLVKAPNTTQRTPWHQDQPYYNITGKQNVSFWIPLDPVPMQSSLQFIPTSAESETWYLPRTFLSKEAKWFPVGSLPETPPIDPTQILSWDLHPGDVLAFHMLALHGSPGSIRRRRIISARYIGDDVRHAPRSWRTSPEFPQDVKDKIPNEAELNHPLFPIVHDESSVAISEQSNSID